MPTRAFTKAEMEESLLLAEVALAIETTCDGDSEEEELAELLLLAACEPAVKRVKQEIGRERLSIDRLRREAAAAGIHGDDMNASVYHRFGFRLADLPVVVRALQPPPGVRTRGSHVCSGEEAVLLLLRRLRSNDPLLVLSIETGRSASAISEIVTFMVEHINERFAHLIDERSFTGWSSQFRTFASVFTRAGVPIDNLVGFIDGKLWPICRPGKYQHIMYSGHKRIHGVKIQGVVFPNGLLVYPFGPCNGSRHDSFILRESELMSIMADTCRDLGATYVLFGDSAYPAHPHLWRMFKGTLTPQMQAFNADMSPERIAIEWLYGITVALWPFVDYRKKLQILKQPVGLYINVAVVLTNIHTCLYGNSVQGKYKMDRPDLSTYMAGGPDAG